MVESFITSLKVLTRRKINTCSDFQSFPKCLSIIDITCVGLSTVLGTGFYTLLAFAAKEKAGPSVVLSFLIASVASCLGGLCFSELSTRFSKGGPSYVYAYATLGELPSFLTGWSMILEFTIASALSAKSLINYLNASFIFNYTSSLPSESKFVLGLNKNFIDFFSVLMIILVGILLCKSFKLTCLINNGLVFFCFLFTTSIVIICLFYMDAGNWSEDTRFFPQGIGGVFSAASTCFFTFHGYELISTIAGESDIKVRNVPIAISLTFLFGLIACFASSVAMTLLIPCTLFELKASILKAVQIREIYIAQYLVIIGAVSGLLASLIGTLIGLSRLLYFMANDGMMFSFLKSCDTQSGNTRCAGWTSCLLSAIMAICFQTETLLMWLGMGTLISYMSASIAIMILRYGLNESLPFELTELSSSSSLKDCSNTINDSDKLMSDSEKSFCLNHHFKSDKLFEEKDLVKNCLPRKHSLLSLDLKKNSSYNTSISSIDNEFSDTQPSYESARKVAGLVTLIMVLMFLMATLTVYIPNILPHGNEWLMELFGTLLFVFILVLSLLIFFQPKHKGGSRNSLPCVPLLPICAIWMDIHLLVCLPSSSMVVFFIWMLIGIFVYMSYGIWHSKEGLSFNDEDIYQFDMNANLDEKDKVIMCLENTTDGCSL